MEDFDLLKRLCDCSGVSTKETKIAEILAAELRTFMPEVKTDRMGNVIARSCEKPDILLIAHMDETGLIAKNVTSEGFIEFEKLGGMLDQFLVQQRVMIHAKEDVPGIVTWKIDPNASRDKLKEMPVKCNDLYIDTGLSKDELLSFGVYPGTIISFDQGTTESKDVIFGKALDDRVGCFVAITAARKLRGRVDFAVVFTVQEETGLKGIQTAIRGMNPKMAIEIEITGTSDTPNLHGKPVLLAIGKGPVVNLADGGEGLTRGYTADRRLVEEIQRLKDPVKLQWKIATGGTSDASIAQVQNSGIPTLSVCVPVRYPHTPVGIVKKGDIASTAEFIEEIVIHLGKTVLRNL